LTDQPIDRPSARIPLPTVPRWVTRAALVLAVACALGACADAPSSSAGSPALERLEDWLAVFNAGDEAALRTFIEASFAPEPKRLLRQRVAREMAERYELLRTNEATARRVVAELGTPRSDQRFGVTVEVDGSPGNRVTRFALSRLSSQLGEEAAVRRGRDHVAALAARGEFSGVVLLARHGRPVFEACYGMADREAKIPVDAATRFSSASVGKMFTAVAVLQLVQAGKLELDAPIIRYLPDYPNAAFAQQATVHQLLSHTSGAGDIDWPVTPEDERRQLQLRTVGDYITRYGPRPPRFAPGSGWAYSNVGYIILGRIIETVSGQDYYGYISQHIFAAAGMSDSSFPTAGDGDARMAVPYARYGNERRALRRNPFYRAMPAGGAAVTARDLVRFASALTEKRLLDAQHLDLLTVGKTEIDRGGVYAYGMLDERARGGAWFGHAGGAPGISTEVRIYPWNGYVVVALSNLDPPATDNVVQELADWLPR
jgi:D-alanyl-D-alanine carboxypeptidase